MDLLEKRIHQLDCKHDWVPFQCSDGYWDYCRKCDAKGTWRPFSALPCAHAGCKREAKYTCTDKHVICGISGVTFYNLCPLHADHLRLKPLAPGHSKPVLTRLES